MGVILIKSIRYPQNTPTKNDIKWTAINGAIKLESAIAAPIKTNAESPNVAIKVATTVP